MLTLQIDNQEMGSTVQRTGEAPAPPARQRHVRDVSAIFGDHRLESIWWRTVIVKQESPLLATERRWIVFSVGAPVAAAGMLRARCSSLRMAAQQAQPVRSKVIVDPEADRVRKSAKYMLRWVGRLENWRKTPGRYRGDADRDEVLQVLRTGPALLRDRRLAAVRRLHD